MFKMSVPTNWTPKSKEGKCHDDSGYAGLMSAKKEDDVLEVFNACLIKRMFDQICISRQDRLWISVAFYSMFLVMLASLCYLRGMGEIIDENQLGGKRAAMKYYHDRVYSGHDAAVI